MKPVGLAAAVCVSSVAAACTLACTPKVNVGAEEPVVITINLNHELRAKLDQEVEDLIGAEEQRGEVATRGLDDDFPLSPEDAREVLAAKQAGAVGEQADGYLGVAPRGEAAAEGLVARVNEGRH